MNCNYCDFYNAWSAYFIAIYNYEMSPCRCNQ